MLIEKRNFPCFCFFFLLSHLSRDGTIVSGDSLGHIQFWDSEFGTLKESFSSHEADILTMTMSQDESTLFASGVDNKVVQLKGIQDPITKKLKWIITGGRRLHTHDVRSLTISSREDREPLIVSGGVDTIIYIVSLKNFISGSYRKISPFPSTSMFSLIPEKNWILYHLAHSLHLWRLGSSKTKSIHLSELEDAAPLEVEHEPVKLLDIHLKVGF